jgi:hypothetical protein
MSDAVYPQQAMFVQDSRSSTDINASEILTMEDEENIVNSAEQAAYTREAMCHLMSLLAFMGPESTTQQTQNPSNTSRYICDMKYRS